MEAAPVEATITLTPEQHAALCEGIRHASAFFRSLATLLKCGPCDHISYPLTESHNEQIPFLDAIIANPIPELPGFVEGEEQV